MCLSYSSLPLVSDPFEAFIIFSIRHEIRRIDLHKRDYSLLVPGLRNTIALDFHFNHSLLYWTDVVEDKIYRGKLSDTGGKVMFSTVAVCGSGLLKNAGRSHYHSIVCINECFYKLKCFFNVFYFKFKPKFYLSLHIFRCTVQ